jgi:squalene-hopene/tetraprenyl-beta-curcumene cyclase
MSSVRLEEIFGTQEQGWAGALPPRERLDGALEEATRALLDQQRDPGHWSYELEADCTIPAEYILMMHFMDEVDPGLQRKLVAYLRAHQGPDGGWALYPGGDPDLSCTVKAYYALKLAGQPPAAPHMRRAREAILDHGGAARANVFTRITLALFGQIPWRGVPFIPVEIMLLPRWFPFHISKVSYWSRTVMVPLFVLCTIRPPPKRAVASVRELFTVPPEQERHYFIPRSRLNRVFFALDRLGHWIEPLIPERIRAHALRRAEAWIIERLNGSGGLGAIFPAMVNAYEALDALGYPPDHPHRTTAREALRGLLVVGEQQAYCQPCVSPVWDTALACLALQETRMAPQRQPVWRALQWLKARQLLDQVGDWSETRPRLMGGGWPFQFHNDHYPDLDDTAAVAWAMLQDGSGEFDEAVLRAADWIQGMQCTGGGFASFDTGNTHYHLNEIPFADHGALLDPPTADVTARCVTLLAMLVESHPRYGTALQAGIAYLRSEQGPGGAWFGRWGTNYIYGTWSALVALERSGVPREDPCIRRAAAWLKATQRDDGGWGETNDSYADPALAGRHHRSTSFQTAWAMLGLMAAGEGPESPALGRGARFLLRTRRAHGLWGDEDFTAPGFPRVFYLRYHGYSRYFPLWALARYRRLRTAAPCALA